MTFLRNAILVLVLGLLAILIQGTVLKSFLPWYLIPNFLVALVVFLAFYENSPAGAVLAFLLGLEIDFYAGQLLLIGPTAGAFVAVFGLVASLSQRIFVDSPLAVFVVTTIAGIASNILYAILVYEFNKSGVSLIPLSLLSVIITAALTPTLFKFFRLVFLGRTASVKLRSRGVVT